MRKPKRCNSCGNDRHFLATARILENGTGIAYSMKQLCFPCLLKIIGVDILWHWTAENTEERERMSGCVSDKRPAPSDKGGA